MAMTSECHLVDKIYINTLHKNPHILRLLYVIQETLKLDLDTISTSNTTSGTFFTWSSKAEQKDTINCTLGFNHVSFALSIMLIKGRTLSNLKQLYTL